MPFSHILKSEEATGPQQSLWPRSRPRRSPTGASTPSTWVEAGTIHLFIGRSSRLSSAALHSSSRLLSFGSLSAVSRHCAAAHLQASQRHHQSMHGMARSIGAMWCASRLYGAPPPPAPWRCNLQAQATVCSPPNNRTYARTCSTRQWHVMLSTPCSPSAWGNFVHIVVTSESVSWASRMVLLGTSLAAPSSTGRIARLCCTRHTQHRDSTLMIAR